MTMVLASFVDNVISRGLDKVVGDAKTAVLDWRAIQKGVTKDVLNDVFDCIFERLFGCVGRDGKLSWIVEYIYRGKIRDGVFKVEAVRNWVCDNDVRDLLKKYAMDKISLEIDNLEIFNSLVDRYVNVIGDAQGVSQNSVSMIIDVVVSSLRLCIKDGLSVALSANANNRILEEVENLGGLVGDVGGSVDSCSRLIKELIEKIECHAGVSNDGGGGGSVCGENNYQYCKEDVVINARIDAYRDMISTDPRAAKDALLKMKIGVDGAISNNTHFRILTNIGACFWGIGELKEAARYFLEALVFNGADPLAIRNAALAHYVTGEFNTAMVYAERAVEIDAHNADGYVLLVALCSSSDELGAVLSRMSPEVLESKSVKYAIGCCYARLKEFEKARDVLFCIYTKYPDCIFSASAYAAALLDCSVGKKQISYLGLDRDASRAFSEAVDILEKVFERVKSSDVLRTHMTAVVNLAQAYRYMGEVERLRGMLALIDSSIDVEHELASLRIHVYALDRDLDGIHTIVKSILRRDHRQSMEIAAAYMHCGDYSEAINVLSGVRSDLCGIDFVRFHSMMSSAIANLRGIEPAEDYIFNICCDASLGVHRCVVLARMYLDLEEYEFSEYVVRDILEQNDFGKGVLGVFVADMCYELKMFFESSVLYKEFGVKFGLSRESRRYAISMFNADIRYDFFDEIWRGEKEFGANGFYRLLKSRFYIRVGCLDHAIDEYGKFFEVEPGGVHDVLLWLSALVRVGQYDKVRAYFALGNLPEGGTSAQYMSIALIMAKVGMVREASNFAYSVCRVVNSDFEVHSMYVSMFLSFDLGFLGEESVTVHENSYFSVKSDGGEVRICIFEDSASELSDGEFRTDHLFFKNFLGMCLGGEWVESDVFGLRTVWSVVSVRHKFVNLYLKLLDVFEVKYPEKFFIKKVNLPSGEGGVDFSPFFRVLEGLEGSVSPLVAAYSSGEIPFSVFAKSMRKNTLDVFSRSLSDPNVSMRAARGANESLFRAIGLLRDASFVVAEITSLYLLYLLGMLDAFIGAFKSVYVVRTSLDELDSWIDEIASREGGQEYFANKGAYYCVEHMHAAVSDELRSVSMFKNIVKTRCGILPAIPVRDFKDMYASHLGELLPQATLDSIYAASGGEGLLLSDDLEVRDLARYVSGVEGVWTQSVILYLLSVRLVSMDNYISIICKLIHWKVDWVYVSVEAFLRSCHESVDFDCFFKIVTVLERRGIDIDKAIKAVRYVLHCLWSSSYSRREVCTYHILSSITTGRNGYACLSEILEVWHRLEDDAGEEFIQCVFRWCLGHFIDPGKVKVYSVT